MFHELERPQGTGKAPHAPPLRSDICTGHWHVEQCTLFSFIAPWASSSSSSTSPTGCLPAGMGDEAGTVVSVGTLAVLCGGHGGSRLLRLGGKGEVEDRERDGSRLQLGGDVVQFKRGRLFKATPPEVDPVDKEFSFWRGITDLRRRGVEERYNRTCILLI